MSELKRLADRIECYVVSGIPDIDRAATRALDEAIASAIGMPLTVELGHEALGNHRLVPARLPRFCNSLDDALTLVPKGWSVSIGEMMGLPLDIRWRAHFRDHRPQSLTNGGHSHIWVEGNAATAPLAVCSSALRARASC